MPLVQRSQQQYADRYPGVPRYALSGADTGSASLHVGDLTFLPGSFVPHHYHPGRAEETQYMIDGELECWLDGHRITVRGGDCVLARPGTGHAFYNRTDRPARMVTIFPLTPPETVHIDDPDTLVDAESHPNIIRAGTRSSVVIGATRHELSGDFSGAESTYAVLYALEPSGAIPNHYHPDHESSLYCLDGAVTAVYGQDDDVELNPGDILNVEANKRHGIHNRSGSPATVLSIHPVINPPASIAVD